MSDIILKNINFEAQAQMAVATVFKYQKLIHASKPGVFIRVTDHLTNIYELSIDGSNYVVERK